jgi:hypothetical protein
MELTEKQKEALPYIQNAVQALVRCWDELAFAEQILGIEIETDELSQAGFNEGFELSDLEALLAKSKN